MVAAGRCGRARGGSTTGTPKGGLVEAILDDDPARNQLELVERRSILTSGDTLWRTDLSGFGSSPGLSGYQVAADAERFLMLEPYPLPGFHEHGIVLLMNWLDRR